MDKHKPFIMICLSWTYLFWGFILLSGVSIDSLKGFVLLALGWLSPTISSLMMLNRYETKIFRKYFYSRILSTKGIYRNDFLIIIFLPLFILLVSVIIAYLLCTFWFPDRLLSIITVNDIFSKSVFSFIAFTLAVFFIGPVPEEIGWRGYLLPALMSKYDIIKSSAYLAMVWGLWHLPLFLIQGYPFSEKVGNPLALFVYFAQLFPKSLVYSVIFLKTRKSIFAVILFHFFINFYGMLIEINTFAQYIEFLLWLVISGYFYKKYYPIIKTSKDIARRN